MVWDVQIIREPRRRRMRLVVKPNGEVHVQTNQSCPPAEILNFLDEHKGWIRTRLESMRKLREQHPPKKIIEGERFPLLGGWVPLRLTTGKGPKAWLSSEGLLLSRPYAEMEAPVNSWREIRRAYKALAALRLPMRVDYWVQMTGLKPARLTLRNQRSRWGSCSSNGTISLNWRTIVFQPDWIDYVIVHELCHLKEPNHSPGFWSLVHEVIPNAKSIRRGLRENQFLPDFLLDHPQLQGIPDHY